MPAHSIVRLVAALVLGQAVIATGSGLGAAADQAPAGTCRPRDGLGNVLAKLEAGKEVRIAYFGGSITAADGWRPKTLAWFRRQFPKAKIQEINATIGGTGSDLGVFRYRQDVLQHKPDLVFVEFSVNDLMGPDAGQVVWTVDGKPGGPAPRFDRYCTYHRLASLKLAEGLADEEHTVAVEIHPQQPDRSSVLGQVRNQPGFDPKKYEGTKVWVGYLMMIGDPLP